MKIFPLLLIYLQIVFAHVPLTPPPPTFPPPRTDFIDLDEPDLSTVAHHTLTTFSTREFISIITTNPRTTISILDKNTTIVPTDEILTASDPITDLQSLTYLELRHEYIAFRRLEHMIPLTPCLDSLGPQSPPAATIRLSNQIQVLGQISYGAGKNVELGSPLNFTTVLLSLGARVMKRVARGRMLEMTVLCSVGGGWTTRVFAYLPVVETEVYARKLTWNGVKEKKGKEGKDGMEKMGEGKCNGDVSVEDGDGEVDGVDKEMVYVGKKRLLSDGLVKTVCMRGTKEDLDCCDIEKNEYVDDYGNKFTWMDL